MIETIAQVFGMTFLGVILICLVWTIISYIMDSNNKNNKLEENMKNYETEKLKQQI